MKQLTWLIEPTSQTLRRIALVATVLVVLALALTVIERQQDAAGDDGRSAVARAEVAVSTLLTYDFRTIATAVEDHADLVAGTFAEEYATLIDDELAGPVRTHQLQNTTTVVESALISTEGDTADVLLFVNQRYSKAGVALEEQQTSGSRVRVTMEKIDGDWRLTSMDPI